MSEQAFGWTVTVTGPSGVKQYHVAVRNRVEAVSAVRRRVVGAATADVEAVTMLSHRAVSVVLRLKPGEVVPVA
jgi:maleate cis-trans isomerase